MPERLDPTNLRPGNYTVAGSCLETFARTVLALAARGMLWSSFCDHKGDWYVSTDDDTDGMQLYALLLAEGLEGVTLIRGGEIRTPAEWLDQQEPWLLDSPRVGVGAAVEPEVE